MYKKKVIFCAIFLVIAILVLVFSIFKLSIENRGHYYISNDGNDSNNGKTPKSAWRTLEKVNNYNFKPGEVIYFNKGDIWRGQLIPKGGEINKSITYSSYGIGENPEILGSCSKNSTNDWKETSKNIWQTNAPDVDVGNIIFNKGEAIGAKVWSNIELNELNEFYYDLKNDTLQLYCYKNPAEVYNSIECAIRKDIINQANKSNIIYDGLSIKYGASHGIGGRNTSNIIIRNCEISFIGGGDFYQDGRQNRYGNGIEFWANAKNNIVENCKIWEVYDAAVTNQNNTLNTIQENIIYRNNKIWNCEYSFEYWNRPEGSITKNILFKENECKHAGMGWGHDQRVNPSGRHLCLSANTSTIENFIIEGNTFYGAEQAIIYLHKNFTGIENMSFYNNKYYQYRDKYFSLWMQQKYSISDFAQYLKDVEVDKESTLSELMP